MSSLDSATSRALSVPELLHAILSFAKRAILSRSAQVSQDWRAASERLFYSQVSVDTEDDIWDDKPPRLEALLRTLSARPDLAKRIAKLNLNVQGDAFAGDSRDNYPFQLATKLMMQCVNLAELKVEGK
jgi:hypothetical protein